MRSKLIPLLVAVAMLAACANSDGGGPPRRRLEGVIVEMDARLLGDVRGFTLQREGRTFDIRITDNTESPFPLDHLHQHMASAEPVAVEVEERNGKLYALSIADG